MKRMLWMWVMGMMACQTDAPQTSGESHWQIGVTNTDVAQMARAFARIEACALPGVTREYVETVLEGEFLSGALAEDLGRQMRCAADAADCDAALACVGWQRTACVGNEARCDGSTVVRCVAEGIEERKDCADDPDGNTVCAMGECVVPEVECAEVPADVFCAGEALVDCASSYRQDCAQRGGVCRDGEDGPGCIVADTGCTPCDGTVARICEDGRIIDRAECAALGMVCAPEGANGRCVPEAPACETGESRCSGDVLQHCFGGVWLDFDCGAVGARCDGDMPAAQVPAACVL